LKGLTENERKKIKIFKIKEKKNKEIQRERKLNSRFNIPVKFSISSCAFS
jgi:hypothetical protein